LKYQWPGSLLFAFILIAFAVLFCYIAGRNYEISRQIDGCLAKVMKGDPSITREQAVVVCLPLFSNNTLLFSQSLIEQKISFWTTTGSFLIGLQKLFVSDNDISKKLFPVAGPYVETVLSSLFTVGAMGIFLSVTIEATFYDHTASFVTKTFACLPGEQLQYLIGIMIANGFVTPFLLQKL